MELLTLESLGLDGVTIQVPACQGFVDQDRKVPCPNPAQYSVSLVHVHDGVTCDTALMCGGHLHAQVAAIRLIEATPTPHLPTCRPHLLRIDTKAVPL